MIGWIARSLARLALIDPQLLSPVKQHGILRFPPTHDVSNVASRSSGSFRQHIGHDIQDRVQPSDRGRGRSKYSFRRYRNTILALSKLLQGWFSTKAQRFIPDHGLLAASPLKCTENLLPPEKATARRYQRV